MRFPASLTMVFVLVASPAYAQQIVRSSNPQGIQIQGDIVIKGGQENSVAVSAGEGNASKNATAAIKESVQIQGSTKITASQKNTTATAVGKNNKASNEAGVIGGE